MVTKSKVELGRYTTVRIGGIADNFYIPESREELVALLHRIGMEDTHILGAGSNLLVNDQKNFPNVIYMRKMDESVRYLGDGKFYVGASVMIPDLIRIVNRQGYGGIEYMYAIPATLGGAVVMNAGLGRSKNQSISQQLVSVEYFFEGKVRTVPAEACKFAYRHSMFQEKNGCVVLGAVLALRKITPAEAERVKRERIEHASKTQDRSGYNFGTIFSKANGKLLLLVYLLNIWRKRGIRLSPKKKNQFINDGTGTYRDAVSQIKMVERLHRLAGQKCSVEVKIWD